MKTYPDDYFLDIAKPPPILVRFNSIVVLLLLLSVVGVCPSPAKSPMYSTTHHTPLDLSQAVLMLIFF